MITLLQALVCARTVSGAGSVLLSAPNAHLGEVKLTNDASVNTVSTVTYISDVISISC